MKKIKTVIVLFALVVSLFGCLTAIDDNKKDEETQSTQPAFDLDARANLDRVYWFLSKEYIDIPMPTDSASFDDEQQKQRIIAYVYNLSICPCAEDDLICMMVLPSVNGEFDRYSVFDLQKMPEEGYSTFLHVGIVWNLMKEKNADLYDKYEKHLASGKSGYYPTEEEYAAFSTLYNECLDIALKDERWIELCEDYDGAYNRNFEAKKERLGKTDWTKDEKFFLDLGFELAAVYSDENLFGDYLTENETPFAIAGTKTQFEKLFKYSLDETGRASDGTIYWLAYTRDPSEKHETLLEQFSHKIPETLAEAEALEVQRKGRYSTLPHYAW
ncbi:MAG: hypothetical protein J5563_04505 [Clostridia bacterium]|nr:hypothetical protein [Clostridia bacterium]